MYKDKSDTKKYPRGYSDDELGELIDKYGTKSVNDPRYGASYFSKATLGLMELHARENNKITKLSLGIATVALIISGISLYFSKIQVKPIIDDYTKEEKMSFNYCLEHFNSYWTERNGATSSCRVILTQQGYSFKSDIDKWDYLFKQLKLSSGTSTDVANPFISTTKIIDDTR